MTAGELSAFVAEVRREVDAIFARIVELHPAALPPPVRAVYEDVRQQALGLRSNDRAASDRKAMRPPAWRGATRAG